MFNNHFLKRLLVFVTIIAVGALITLVVNYIEDQNTSAVSAQGFDS